MSDQDIEAGKRWASEIATQLEQARFGIICVTPENAGRPWLNFESGALAKMLADTYVVPYLLGMRATDLQGPLAQFQAKTADRDGTWEMVKAINRAAGEGADLLAADRLRKTFDRWWPDLESAISEIRPPEEPLAKRPDGELLVELLALTRDLVHRQAQTERMMGDVIEARNMLAHRGYVLAAGRGDFRVEGGEVGLRKGGQLSAAILSATGTVGPPPQPLPNAPTGPESDSKG